MLKWFIYFDNCFDNFANASQQHSNFDDEYNCCRQRAKLNEFRGKKKNLSEKNTL
jgi:hypothetical protein